MRLDPDGAPVLASVAPLVIGLFAVIFSISLVFSAKSKRFRARQLAALARMGDGWALHPRSRRTAWFVAVALTAGVCEEVAFRRLLPVFITRLGGDDLWVPMLVSSVAFGFAHRSQGLRGVVMTGLLGLGLFCLVATTGSLWPAIAVHALIDLRVAAMYPAFGPIPIPPFVLVNA